MLINFDYSTLTSKNHKDLILENCFQHETAEFALRVVCQDGEVTTNVIPIVIASPTIRHILSDHHGTRLADTLLILPDVTKARLKSFLALLEGGRVSDLPADNDNSGTMAVLSALLVDPLLFQPAHHSGCTSSEYGTVQHGTGCTPVGKVESGESIAEVHDTTLVTPEIKTEQNEEEEEVAEDLEEQDPLRQLDNEHFYPSPGPSAEEPAVGSLEPDAASPPPMRRRRRRRNPGRPRKSGRSKSKQEEGEEIADDWSPHTQEFGTYPSNAINAVRPRGRGRGSRGGTTIHLRYPARSRSGKSGSWCHQPQKIMPKPGGVAPAGAPPTSQGGADPPQLSNYPTTQQPPIEVKVPQQQQQYLATKVAVQQQHLAANMPLQQQLLVSKPPLLQQQQHQQQYLVPKLPQLHQQQPQQQFLAANVPPHQLTVNLPQQLSSSAGGYLTAAASSGAAVVSGAGGAACYTVPSSLAHIGLPGNIQLLVQQMPISSSSSICSSIPATASLTTATAGQLSRQPGAQLTLVPQQALFAPSTGSPGILKRLMPSSGNSDQSDRSSRTSPSNMKKRRYICSHCGLEKSVETGHKTVGRGLRICPNLNSSSTSVSTATAASTIVANRAKTITTASISNSIGANKAASSASATSPATATSATEAATNILAAESSSSSSGSIQATTNQLKLKKIAIAPARNPRTILPRPV